MTGWVIRDHPGDKGACTPASHNSSICQAPRPPQQRPLSHTAKCQPASRTHLGRNTAAAPAPPLGSGRWPQPPRGLHEEHVGGGRGSWAQHMRAWWWAVHTRAWCTLAAAKDEPHAPLVGPCMGCRCHMPHMPCGAVTRWHAHAFSALCTASRQGEARLGMVRQGLAWRDHMAVGQDEAPSLVHNKSAEWGGNERSRGRWACTCRRHAPSNCA